MASKRDDEGFEAIYRRLEETVAKLEQGNLTLEESIALYEEGMELARRSQELLSAAELRITRLQESFTNGIPLGEEPEVYVPVPDDGDSMDDLPQE